jgi:ribosomal protein S21
MCQRKLEKTVWFAQWATRCKYEKKSGNEKKKT